MATFRKRADLFGQTLLLEAEGQVRSAFADHPEFVQNADLQWYIARSIGKRIAGQFVARWEQLTRVRRALQARALDSEDGLATGLVIPSRRLQRRLVSAEVPPRRQIVSASSKRRVRGALTLSAGPFPASGRQAAEDAAYRRLIKELGHFAGQTRHEIENAATPVHRIRATIRHGAVVDALRALAARRQSRLHPGGEASTEHQHTKQ